MLGSTLTLRPQRATILSSALTIFIAIAGTQLWYLCKFALHQSRATTQSRNLLYHQTQSVLRNTSSDIDAFKQLFRLMVAWRHHRDVYRFKTVLPLLGWAFVHFVLIVGIGVFSSWLLDAGSDVLSISPWCGNYNNVYYNAIRTTTYQSNLSAVRLSTEFNTYSNARVVLVQQQVDMCGAGKEQCDGPRPQPINFTSVFAPATCPVADAICHPDAGGSMLFDTGLMSSHRDLGYNSAEDDRIYVRLQAQCAPLKADGYVTGWQTEWNQVSQRSRQVCDANYGTSEVNDRNATASISKHDFTCDETLTRTPYVLMPYFAFPGIDGKLFAASFDPIPELYPTNSDSNLVVWSFQNAYADPVTDPWFSAQQPVTLSNSSCLFRDVQVYTRGHPLTAMVCTQKWQICTSDDANASGGNSCTDEAGIFQIAADLTSTSPRVALNQHQKAIKNRVMSAAGRSSFYYVISALAQSSSPPLKVRNMIQSATLPRIPPDQWRKEATYWMELLLMYFQGANLDYSTGQFAASTDYINVTRPASRQSPNPSQDAAHWLCQNQTITSRAYRNYNFFALCLLAFICLLIILLGWCIEDITGCFRTRSLRHRKVHQKQNMWRFNSDLDMLRLIDELQRGTKWTVSKNGIPLTHRSHIVSVNSLMNSKCGHANGENMLANLDRNATGHYSYGHQDRAHESCLTCGRSGVSSNDTSRLMPPSLTNSGRSSQDTPAFESGIHDSSESFLRSRGGLLVT